MVIQSSLPLKFISLRKYLVNILLGAELTMPTLYIRSGKHIFQDIMNSRRLIENDLVIFLNVNDEDQGYLQHHLQPLKCIPPP